MQLSLWLFKRPVEWRNAFGDKVFVVIERVG